MTNNRHCCQEMCRHLDSGEIAITYVEQFREYGIDYRKGFGGGIQTITYCPWCGQRLPKPLRDEWFALLDEQGLEPDDLRVPAEMNSDAWWRARQHHFAQQSQETTIGYRLLASWKRLGLDVRPGVSDAELVQFEARHDIVLPNALRQYYSVVDGMGESMLTSHPFRFWPLREVKRLSEELPAEP